MRKILPLLFFILPSTWASVVGISTHPFKQKARIISAEMLGYMGDGREVAMGLKYTQEVSERRVFDVSVAGGQETRALVMGAGLDFALLDETVGRPRVSFKPFFQYLKVDDRKESVVGAAPTMRKGLSLNEFEFFPYLALPVGIKVNGANDEYVYYSSLSFGASMPFPGANTNQLLLSVEANKDMGASSDYVGCLVSWVWE